MVENGLLKAVAGLVAMNQDLKRSRDIAANAQRYRDLTSEVERLRSGWRRVAQRAQIARSIGAPLPAEYEVLRSELRELLQQGFAEFEGRYVSPEGVAVLKGVAPGLIRRFGPLEESIGKAIDEPRLRTHRDLEDVTFRARIRTQCGLPADEAGVAKLREEITKFFANLQVLNAPSRSARWSSLLEQLHDMEKQHDLEGVSGLSPDSLAFLRLLMSDGRHGTLTLADLTPEIFAELRRFPTLLAGVRLVRKGAS